MNIKFKGYIIHLHISWSLGYSRGALIGLNVNQFLKPGGPGNPDPDRIVLTRGSTIKIQKQKVDMKSSKPKVSSLRAHSHLSVLKLQNA